MTHRRGYWEYWVFDKVAGLDIGYRVASVTENGINALRHVDNESEFFGCHACNGTTQGGRSGPDDFKAYYVVMVLG